MQGLKAMVSVATAGENVCPVRAGVEEKQHPSRVAVHRVMLMGFS